MRKVAGRGDVKIFLMICCGWYPLLFFAAYLYDFDRAHIWNWKFPQMSWLGTRPAIIGMLLIFAIMTAFFTYDVYRNRHSIRAETPMRCNKVKFAVLILVWLSCFLLFYGVYDYDNLYFWQSAQIYCWQSRPFYFCVACMIFIHAIRKTYFICRSLLASRSTGPPLSEVNVARDLQSLKDGAKIE